jgi:hypothetical protein
MLKIPEIARWAAGITARNTAAAAAIGAAGVVMAGITGCFTIAVAGVRVSEFLFGGPQPAQPVTAA